MSYETIQLEMRGAVCVLTLNRPDRLNALNVQVARDLARSELGLHGNESIPTRISRGNNGAFTFSCADRKLCSLLRARSPLTS